MKSYYPAPLARDFGPKFNIPVRGIIVLLAIVTFGPYLTSSIRTEHLVLYPAALLAAAALIQAHWRQHSRLPLLIALLFGGILMASAFSTFFGVYPVGLPRVFSQADNWIQPIALAVIALAWGPRLKEGFGWLVGLLSVNAGLQIYQAITNNFAIVARWVGNEEGGTALNSFGNGRFLGVFSQPLEAGIAYAVGLFLWFYLLRNGARGFFFWLSLLLLLAGGTLTVSKMFLIAGLPLFLIAVAWDRIASGWVLTWSGLTRGTLLTVSIVGAGSVIGSYWSGTDYALRLLNPEGRTGSLLDFYTSSRLGGDTVLAASFAQVIQEEPWAGYGFKSFEIIDNAFLDAYSQGGVVALAFYIAALAAVLVTGFQQGRRLEGRLLILLAIFMIGASFGAPALTVNRACIVLWIAVFGLAAARVRPELRE